MKAGRLAPDETGFVVADPGARAASAHISRLCANLFGRKTPVRLARKRHREVRLSHQAMGDDIAKLKRQSIATACARASSRVQRSGTSPRAAASKCATIKA